MRRRMLWEVPGKVSVLTLSVIVLGVPALRTQVKTPWAKRATSKPISNQMVPLLFTAPNGGRIYAAQREGGMVRIETGDATYGFVPRIRDKATGDLQVVVF